MTKRHRKQGLQPINHCGKMPVNHAIDPITENARALLDNDISEEIEELILKDKNENKRIEG